MDKKIVMNTHLREVISKSAISGVMLGVAAVLQLIFSVLVSRELGADLAGVFFLSLNVMLFLGIISRLGLDMSIVRFGSPLFAKRDSQGLKNLSRSSVGLAMPVGLALSVVVYFAAPAVAENVFDDPRLEPGLRLMVFSLIPIVLSSIYSELLRAQKKVGQSLGVKHVARLAIAVILVFFFASSIASVSLAFVASTAATAIIGFYLFDRSVRELKSGPKTTEIPSKALLYASLPLLFVVLSGRSMEWMDSVMLGALDNSESVSLYNAAIQISLTVNFVLLAFNTINSAKFSELYSSGNIDDLKALFSKSTRIMVAIATPVSLSILLFGNQFLSVFGTEFTEARTALTILAIAQLINVSVGSVGYLLAMTDHGRILARVVLFVNIINVLLNLVLIPEYGINGAAIATAASIVLKNLILLWFVRDKIYSMTDKEQ